jgi:hypothetical protein
MPVIKTDFAGLDWGGFMGILFQFQSSVIKMG